MWNPHSNKSSLPRILAAICGLLFIGGGAVNATYNSGVKTTVYTADPQITTQTYTTHHRSHHYVPVSGEYQYTHNHNNLGTNGNDNDYQTTVTHQSRGSASQRVPSSSSPASASSYGSHSHSYHQHEGNYYQQQHEPPHHQQYQQQQPIYERGQASQNVQQSGVRWQNGDNDITDYYTGCPSGHTGQLPYAYDCRRFLNCWKGRGHIQSCSVGTVFNPETLECDRPDKVKCGATMGGQGDAIQTPKHTYGQLTQPAQSNNRAGRFTEASADVDILCPPAADGLQPHPSDCTKFINCANGNVHIQECGPGTAFSISMKVCDFKDKVDCSGRGSRAEVNVRQDTQPTTSSAAPGGHSDLPHNADILCLNGITGLFPYPFDYTKFINCKNGNTAIQNCVQGTAFSISKGYCEPLDQIQKSDHVMYIVSEVSYEYSQTLITCPPGTEGIHLYPFDAEKYIKCVRSQMEVVTCSPAQVFSVTRRTCLPLRQVLKYERVRLLSEMQKSNSYRDTEEQYDVHTMVYCPLGLSGTYPHPFDGSKYIRCGGGRMVRESCASGNAYSLSRKECDTMEDIVKNDRVPTIQMAYGQEWRVGDMETTFGSTDGLTYLMCPPGLSGYFLHPFDCTKYIECSNGATSIETCINGAVYSISRQECIPRDKVEAFDRVDYLTTTKHEFSSEHVRHTDHDIGISCGPGTFGIYPHPQDCHKYMRCANGRIAVENCPPGQVFSIAKSFCHNEHEVSQQDRSSYTRSEANGQHGQPGYATGGATTTTTTNNYNVGSYQPSAQDVGCAANSNGRYPHPHDCTKFVMCSNGVAHVQSCGPGTAWNKAMEVCDFKDKVDCSQTGAVTVRQQPEIACPPGAEGLYQHPYDWRQYLSCANGVTHVMDCAPGTVFSVSRKICDLEANVVNADRCNNGVYSTSYDYSQYAPNSNSRDSKAYGTNQWSYTGTSQTHSSNPTHTQGTQQGTAGDRWTNMNVPRPQGSSSTWQRGSNTRHTTVTQPESTSVWSGTAVNVDQQSPTHTVIYEEGSLRPDRNYNHMYSAPLAPLPGTSSTSTSTIVYAQPIGSQEASEEVFDSHNPQPHAQYPYINPNHNPNLNQRNHTGNIHYLSSGNTWTAISPNPHPPVLVTSHLMPPLQAPGQEPGIAPTQPLDQLMPPLAPAPETSHDPCSILRPPYKGTPVQFDFPCLENPHPSLTHAGSPYPGSPHPSYPHDGSPYKGSSHPSHHHGGPSYPGSPHGGPPYPASPHLPSPHDRPPYPGRPHPPAPHERPPYTGIPQPPSPHERPPHTAGSNVNRHITHDRPPYTGIPQPPSPHERPPHTAGSNVNRPILHLMPPTHSNDDKGQEPLSETDPTVTNADYFPGPYDTNELEPETSDSRKVSTVDETNLYGGLQPPFSEPQEPTTNRSYLDAPAETTQIPPPSKTTTPMSFIHGYPTLSNATIQTFPNQPHYSQPYAEVTHSRNSSWTGRKIPQHSSIKPTNIGLTRSENSKKPGEEIGEHSRFENHDTTDKQPEMLHVKEALQLLLRPYFNRSGKVDDDMAAKAQSHIMSLVAPTDTAPEQTTTTHNPLHATSISIPSTTPHQDDVELILAGEQHSLVSTTSTKPGAHETSTYYDLQHTTVESQRSTQSVSSGHTHDHNSNWHKNHQHSPSSSKHHQHSREFHEKHPHLPNPFVETPDPMVINVRSLDDCPFNCGNGRCIAQHEVCNGVNNCGNRKDEEQCEHLGYEVRLTGGESSNKGRVEVKILGKWGYVCDDKFGLKDADVLCRELGFRMGAVEVRGSSYYPPTDVNTPFKMDEVECNGNETSLRECDFKGWGVNNCGPDEIVGVVCKVQKLKCPDNYWLCHKSEECIPTAFLCDVTPDCTDGSDENPKVCNAPIEYRLEGGRSKSAGRLEIFYRGEWGTVCDDDFSLKEAQVVCNSIGFYGKPKVVKNIYGPGSGPIWLDQVSCLGNETSLDKCNHWTWGENNCQHTEDVGIECTNGPKPNPNHPVITTPATDTLQQSQIEYEQSELDDLGKYQGLWQRSSKASNQQKQCGHFKSNLADEYAHPEQRVINGSIAKRGRHPWQATIRTRGRGGISSHWCGAVIVSKKLILTAAHCLAGYPKGSYFVRVGDHYANIAEASEIDSNIEDWYIHEKFRDEKHMNNDIALILLKNSLRFNDYVQPVCLPEKGSQLEANRMCTISGWGSIKSGTSTPSNILRSAEVPILRDDVCSSQDVYSNAMSDGMFCAGYLNENVDACDGDSGGPLVCSDDDGETLYGIISWGQHCGYTNRPGVYVRVEKYMDWIYEKISAMVKQGKL